MKKLKAGRKFGRVRAQRRALLYGITASLFLHGSVRTTEARAKAAQSVADRAITAAKKGTLASRRQLEGYFSSSVVRKLAGEIAPRYRARAGGYTRIVKLPPRAGDASPMALLELVERNE